MNSVITNVVITPLIVTEHLFVGIVFKFSAYECWQINMFFVWWNRICRRVGSNAPTDQYLSNVGCVLLQSYCGLCCSENTMHNLLKFQNGCSTIDWFVTYNFLLIHVYHVHSGANKHPNLWLAIYWTICLLSRFRSSVSSPFGFFACFLELPRATLFTSLKKSVSKSYLACFGFPRVEVDILLQPNPFLLERNNPIHFGSFDP